MIWVVHCEICNADIARLEPEKVAPGTNEWSAAVFLTRRVDGMPTWMQGARLEHLVCPYCDYQAFKAPNRVALSEDGSGRSKTVYWKLGTPPPAPEWQAKRAQSREEMEQDFSREYAGYQPIFPKPNGKGYRPTVPTLIKCAKCGAFHRKTVKNKTKPKRGREMPALAEILDFMMGFDDPMAVRQNQILERFGMTFTAMKKEYGGMRHLKTMVAQKVDAQNAEPEERPERESVDEIQGNLIGSVMEGIV